MSVLRVAAILGLGIIVDAVTGASVPGYGAGLGVAGVVLLVLASRALGVLARRGVGYYDEVDVPDPVAFRDQSGPAGVESGDAHG